MKILFLHGWRSVPGGVKPTYLGIHGHEVINPALDDDNFTAAVATAQAEFDLHRPMVVVGSSRGGAVAMNIHSRGAKLVLLCPAWKKYGAAKAVKPGTVLLHSRADEVIPFADSEELARKSGATLIEVGSDHRLADPAPLAAMLGACEGRKSSSDPGEQQHNDNPMAIVQAVPVLEVADVAASIQWYQKMLGFSADPFPDSPPYQFAILRHGQAELMLRRGTPTVLPGRPPYQWNVYLRLDGGRIRQLCAELSRGGVVSRRLERMFYGLAEFEIKDPDGYAICLAEEIGDSQDSPTPQP